MQCSVSDTWRMKTDCGARTWRPRSKSWNRFGVHSCLRFLRQDSPSRGAGYHQGGHFCVHPKLLIRGSWIFRYLSPLICLTISILSLGLFCIFFSIACLFSFSCFIVRCDQFWDNPNYSQFLERLGLLSALAASFPWLFLLPKMSRWWNSLQKCHFGNLLLHFVKFILKIIIQYMCL